MKDVSYWDEDFDIWLLLVQATRAMRRNRRKELRQIGISNAESMILWIIETIGHRATPAEIARCTMLESHSVSERLAVMQEKGLINKVKDLERKNTCNVREGMVNLKPNRYCNK